MGQVARPHCGVPLPKAQINANFYILLLEVTRHGRFIIIGHRQSVARDQGRTKADRKRVTVCRFAGFTNGHDDAAPIGILTRYCRFDQGRIGNGQAHAPRTVIANGPCDLNFNKFLRTFAIPHHEMRQLPTDIA